MASFNLDDPKLDPAIAEAALTSGDYPYDKRMKKSAYAERLRLVQIELVKLQAHLIASGRRIALVFEGRDAAGKGGTIKRYLENLNPRHNRIAALPKPSDREAGQWYFQRYVAHLPSAGETVLFDRSWYNRAVVEPVMEFCTPEQTAHFLREAPQFERMLVDDDIIFYKFWLNIGRETQLMRFHQRRHDPVKVWKLSPVDLKSLDRWDEYTQARNAMIAATHQPLAPWTVILANDKRRARLAVIQHVLWTVDYPDKDFGAIGAVDDKIVLAGDAFLTQHG